MERRDDGRRHGGDHQRGRRRSVPVQLGEIIGEAIISSAQGAFSEKNVLNLLGEMTNENLKVNVQKIIDFNPEHIRGYVGSLYILAKYCLDNKIQIKNLKSINPSWVSHSF